MSPDTPAPVPSLESVPVPNSGSAPAHYAQLDELYRGFRQASSQAFATHTQSQEALLSTLDTVFSDFGKQLVGQRQQILNDANSAAEQIINEAKLRANASLETLKAESTQVETVKAELEAAKVDFSQAQAAQKEEAAKESAKLEASRLEIESMRLELEKAKLDLENARRAVESQRSEVESAQREVARIAALVAPKSGVSVADIRPSLGEDERASQIVLQPVESEAVQLDRQTVVTPEAQTVTETPVIESPLPVRTDPEAMPQDSSAVSPPLPRQEDPQPTSTAVPPLPSILAQHMQTTGLTAAAPTIAAEQAPIVQQPVQEATTQPIPAPQESPAVQQAPPATPLPPVVAEQAPAKQPLPVSPTTTPETVVTVPLQTPQVSAQAPPPESPQAQSPAPTPALPEVPVQAPPEPVPVAPVNELPTPAAIEEATIITPAETTSIETAREPEPEVIAQTETIETPFIAVQTAKAITPHSPVPTEPIAASEVEEALPEEVVLRTVAQRTGYPVEMLTDYLKSGTDLEIGQSKLVEIFSTLVAQFPRAPKLDLPSVPKLSSLTNLVAYLTKSPDQPSPANDAGTSPPLPDSPPEVRNQPADAQPAPPSSDTAASPFQVAPEDSEQIQEPAAEATSPFQVAEDEAKPAVASAESPFLVAPEQLDTPEEEPLTPFHALAVDGDNDSQSEDVASPFHAAEPVASPFQAAEAIPPAVTEVAPATNISVTAEQSTAPEVIATPEVVVTPPQALPEPEPDYPTVAIDRFVNHSRVSPPCGLGLAQLHRAGVIHLVPDDRRVAEALRDLLIAEGLQSEVVREVPPTSTAVIVLNGLKQASTTEQALAIQLEAFQAAKALANNVSNRPGLFVTVQDTGGDFGITSSEEDRAWIGGLTGLTRSVSAEFPNIGVKALDLEREGRSAEVLARRIFRELTEGGPEVEIGLSADGTRLARAMERKEIEPGPLNLADDSIVVVLGAGEPILSEPIKALGRRKRLRFVLLGHTAYQETAEDPFQGLTNPDDIRNALRKMHEEAGEAIHPEAIEQQTQQLLAQREIRNTIQALSATGSTACYFAVDATDASALETVLTQVRNEWGPISGLIHNTGVVREGRIDQKSPESFRAILHANITGIENLLALTKQDALQLICFLSPSLQHSSSTGHADYSTANEILNKTACAEARHRGSQCLVRSINWSYWDDGTLPEQVKSVLHERGVALVPRQQTGAIIVQELSGSPHAEVEITISPKQASLAAPALSNFNSQMEINVSHLTTPNLTDHRIQGSPAVPAVMVMEWFMRNSRQIIGPRELLRCRDFKQLQGIALPNFNEGGAPFNIVTDSLASLQSGGASAMSLQDMDGQLRYTGIIERVANEDELGLTPAPELELERTAWTGSHVYGPGALFHGPSFQVIHRVEGVSPQGALGRLLPPEDARWSQEKLLFHPAMIDGATQLAFVWGLFTQDNEFLATSIGEFVQAPNANYDQALRCILEGIETTPEKLTFNIYLESDAAEPVAVLRNVECQPLVPPARPAGTN